MKKKCTYCEKIKEVELCPHCEKLYCSTHVNPIEPGSYHPGKSRVMINQIRLGQDKSHPCPDYVDHLAKQKKVQDKKWGETLNQLTGKSAKSGDESDYVGVTYQDTKKHKDEPYLYRYIPPKEHKKGKKDSWKKLKYWQKGGIIGFIIGLLMMIILFIPDNSTLGKFEFIGLIQEYILFPWIFILILPPFSCYEDCSREYLYANAVLFIILFALIGALIGLIISKIKKK